MAISGGRTIGSSLREGQSSQTRREDRWRNLSPGQLFQKPAPATNFVPKQPEPLCVCMGVKLKSRPARPWAGHSVPKALVQVRGWGDILLCLDIP